MIGTAANGAAGTYDSSRSRRGSAGTCRGRGRGARGAPAGSYVGRRWKLPALRGSLRSLGLGGGSSVGRLYRLAVSALCLRCLWDTPSDLRESGYGDPSHLHIEGRAPTAASEAQEAPGEASGASSLCLLWPGPCRGGRGSFPVGSSRTRRLQGSGPSRLSDGRGASRSRLHPTDAREPAVPEGKDPRPPHNHNRLPTHELPPRQLERSEPGATPDARTTTNPVRAERAPRFTRRRSTTAPAPRGTRAPPRAG